MIEMSPILFIFFFLYCLVCINCDSGNDKESNKTYLSGKAYKK